MNQSIEKMSAQELLAEWQTELGHLQTQDHADPTWAWKPVQLHLERLHSLAKEIRTKKAQDRAKWQP